MQSRVLARHAHTSTTRIFVIIPRRTIKTQTAFHPKEKVDPDPSASGSNSNWSPGLASPRQLVEYLNDYVVGQPRAKKILAVAVYNHYNRVRANIGPSPDIVEHSWDNPPTTGSNDISLLPHITRKRSFPHPPARQSIPLFEKSNVLVIGPTGSGKTLLARTLARVLDVPFSVSDATTFTQAGYVGDDVEMCVHRLLQASNWDPHRASTGIIYIDEADKLARRGPGGDGLQRDVGGEGVQQALLRMMEGSVVTVNANRGNEPGAGPPPDARRPRPPNPPNQETYQVDTSNILFILSGAFVGLDRVVKKRISKGSIGFGASLASQNAEEDSFMPFFTKNGEKADAWSLVEPTDLVTYGYIPEFMSRLPVLTSLNQLTIPDLYRILTEVKGSLVSQYTALFGYSSVEIRFTTPALREVARQAKERGGGARGLRGIMENLLLDAMYDVPGSSIRYVLINEKVVKGEIPAMYWSRGDGTAFWRTWADEEEQDTMKRAKANEEAESSQP